MSIDIRAESCNFLDSLQRRIVSALEKLDPNGPRFDKQSISASANIQNTSYVLQRTDVNRTINEPPFAPIEKAILTMTQVKNRMPPNMPVDFLKGHGARNPDVTTPTSGASFFVVNLTVFVHPRSPHAPTGHGTWRFFEILDSNDKPIDWWFGGASNLTPSYVYEEDCEQFHRTFKLGSSGYGEHTHEPLKKWCDEYFYNPYRKEQCGIGGIFFDGLSDKPHRKLDFHGEITKRPKSAHECLDFFKSTGESFMSAYTPILERRVMLPWTQEERNWQLLRRGCFVEFCLLVDEGVKFGIQTGSGSLDAILLILPETAQWVYDPSKAAVGERETRLEKVLKEPKNWA